MDNLIIALVFVGIAIAPAIFASTFSTQARSKAAW